MNETIASSPTPADLRAAIARARVPLYVVAGRVRVHPVHLSRLLHGQIPVRPELAAKITEVLVEEGRE